MNFQEERILTETKKKNDKLTGYVFKYVTRTQTRTHVLLLKLKAQFQNLTLKHVYYTILEIYKSCC